MKCLAGADDPKFATVSGSVYEWRVVVTMLPKDVTSDRLRDAIQRVVAHQPSTAVADLYLGPRDRDMVIRLTRTIDPLVITRMARPPVGVD